MKEQFKEINFRTSSRILLQNSIAIIESDEYQKAGLRLTLRQLYYQLVSRNMIANLPQEYGRLSTVISDARLGGYIDWDAIEDRVRSPRHALEFDSLQHCIKWAATHYRLPRWEHQDNYVELWVEKDALAGVLWPLAYEYHITLMVNRGYSSQSAMYESANRFKDAHQRGKECFLFYLGDHDPSGEDMVRDIKDRLEVFNATVKVEKIALTWKQIKKYSPPENPTKIQDPRANKYIAKYGNSCWEVDALPPSELQKLIRKALDKVTDHEAIDIIRKHEDHDRATMLKKVKRWKNSRPK